MIRSVLSMAHVGHISCHWDEEATLRGNAVLRITRFGVNLPPNTSSKQTRWSRDAQLCSQSCVQSRHWPQRRGAGGLRWPRGPGRGPASAPDEDWHRGSGVNLCNRRICIQMKNDRIFLFSTTFNVIRIKLALSTKHPPPHHPPTRTHIRTHTHWLPSRRLKNIHYLWSWGTLFAINLHRRSMT